MASGTKIADMTVGLHFDGSKMYVDMKNISKKAETAASSSGQTAGKAFSTKWAAAMGVVSGIASTAFSKISSMISSSMSGAINRMDTMNNFPKVMQSLGYEADEAGKSVQKMADHLDGLPTTLDDMVSNTQQLAASMGNLNKGTVNATSVGLAFNDMMLAGGKGTEAASRAFIQYNQMLAKGKVDMQSWNSLVEAAPGQMNQLAESLLGAGKNQRDLYQALQEGTLSFEQMNAAMVKLDTEGAAGFASFNEQAIAGTTGLATQLENIRTSITKVITAALQGGDMAQPIEQLMSRIQAAAKQIIPGIGRLIGGIIDALPTMLQGITDVLIDYIPDMIDGLMSKLPEVVQGAINFIVAVVNKIVPQLPRILMSIVNGIMETIKTLFRPENMKAMQKAGMELFKSIVKAIPDILVAIIQALPDIITGIVEFLVSPENLGMMIQAAITLFLGIVQALPQIMGALLGAIGELFGNLWNGIQEMAVNVFASLPAPIQQFLMGVYDVVKNIVTAIQNAVGVVAGVIGNIIGVIGGAIGASVEWIIGIFQGLFDFIGGIFNGIGAVINNFAGFVGGIFEGIGSFVTGVFQGIASFIGGVFDTIGGIIKAPINVVIDLINGVLSFINSLTIPDWVPGIGGWHTDIPMIPKLAQGGLANGATTAIIGEAGREAVLPLDRNTENWSGLLASALAEEMQKQETTVDQRPIQVTINNEINSELDAREIGNVMMQSIRRAV